MTAERSALPDPFVSRVELDGLEDLFDGAQKDLRAVGLSLSEAVYYFGKSKKQIKRLVKSRELPAIRIGDQDRGKWRVFPEGVPEEFAHLIPQPEPVEEARTEQPAAHLPATNSQSASSQVWLAGHEDGQSVIAEAVVPAPKPRSARKRKPPEQETIADQLQDQQKAVMAGESSQAIEQEQIEHQKGEAPLLESSELVPNPEPGDSGECDEPAVEPQAQECAILPVREPGAETTIEARLDQALAKIEYLESRITGLEDEVRYLTRAHHRPVTWSAAVFVIPLVAIVLTILFRAQF